MNKNYERAVELFSTISERHSLHADDNRMQDTTREEQDVLAWVDLAIGEGFVDAYPMKALLVASNNWGTLCIVRPTLFQVILREGVEKGCLDPKNHDEAWEWMRIAAENNDPTSFLDDDMEQYYDILMTATEHGNDIAHDIMDEIWEPENIIEED